jgi:thiol-disulfide isomerase/thioredoxin
MVNFVNFNSTSGVKLPIGGDDSSNILSRIKSAGGKMSSTTIVGIIAFILFGCLALFYYFYYVSPNMKASYKPNSEQIPVGSETSGNSAELLFFFADWCPHCKAAKPIWNDLKAEYENKTINGYTVVFTEIDCSAETAEVDKMMNKYNIEGYPTIKLLKDGQVIEYDAKPSKATLSQFLNTVL